MSRHWGLSCVLYVFIGVPNVWSYGPPSSDQQLLLQIEQQLKQHTRSDATKFHIRVTGGIANITGEVPTYADRMLLERLCRRVEGVTAVDNRLQVVSVWVSDEALTQSIKERMAADSLLCSQNVQVSAKSGVVVLSGTVPTWTDRRRATAAARQVQGVTSLQNDLAVSGSTEGPRVTVSDATINTQLQRLLDNNSPLAQLELKCHVDRGIVALEGALPSVQQKNFLRDVVRAIPGVVQVDLRKVRVAAEHGPSAIDFADDNSAAARQAMLQMLIDASSIDRPQKVSVQLQDGKLVLEGEVNSLAQQHRLLELAKAFGGASSIGNQLVVMPPPRTDEAIERELRSVMGNDAILGAARLTVKVQDGAATLTGRVPDFNTKARTCRVATRIAGLVAIDNRVTVSWSPSVSDDGLKRTIEKELQDKFAMQINGIELEVADGVVTLRGTVPSVALERSLVELVAGIDCVRSVQNRMAVAQLAAEIAGH